jgi:hypothetical protein
MSKITVVMRHGKPTIVAEGFEGNTCYDKTSAVEQKLSGPGGVDIREHTAVETEEPVEISH